MPIKVRIRAPSAGDIRRRCRAADAEALAEGLIAQSLHAESMYAEWRHQVRHGLKQLQNSSAAFFRRTELFRFYSSLLVPGLLHARAFEELQQTAVYGAAARTLVVKAIDSLG